MKHKAEGAARLRLAIDPEQVYTLSAPDSFDQFLMVLLQVLQPIAPELLKRESVRLKRAVMQAQINGIVQEAKGER